MIVLIDCGVGDDPTFAYVNLSVYSSGVIEAANVIDGKLTIRVDDPTYATPADVNVDLPEVDR
ncbi:hypothetical protein [Natronorubrum tibetense]|uniref:Uncharacterized protein n=1 Tax=Natronorubrum tibetense GA33 TaxID=1114856 RepID=L9VKJ8_9EURY|nr:hypothetical protein [Natronorubrum tibetense]ELY37735.1 hypothetical protein C496_19545 [Natronorubrum tibetense GA33]